MSKRYPITAEGYEKIQATLKDIISVQRPQNIADIESARAHGDLKENAEYHAAKEKQGLIEARLQYLNDIIANCQIIDTAGLEYDDVRFGAKVSFINLETEETSTWSIVGKYEADIKADKISLDSPIGKALLGKKIGDEVKIIIPKGNITVEIIDIKYE